MTTADAVRARLGLGRLLPLGGPEDGAWLTEQAADPVLRLAAGRIEGAVPGRLRVTPADPDGAAPPGSVPAPPSALPPGPLRIEADFAATADLPLPAVASAVRDALFTAAVEELGLTVTEVDLRVTELLDAPEGDGAATAGESPTATPPVGGRAVSVADPAARVAAAAPGVARLTATLGAAVHLASDHVRVEVAVARGHRPLDVVRAVRAAVSAELGDGRPVSVLVTAVAV
ncbi:hypothetical protein [Streptomyces sp. NPDC020965]|uniref:hypothetical protein n=1 Tax=Streptomyces sp. NPDC020965 TaxID=3365105 RepID=UPI0037AF4479